MQRQHGYFDCGVGPFLASTFQVRLLSAVDLVTAVLNQPSPAVEKITNEAIAQSKIAKSIFL
jgi:hypothetical protein